jgi:hypothetical protein
MHPVNENPHHETRALAQKVADTLYERIPSVAVREVKFPSTREARDHVLSQIPETAVIGVGDSVTFRQLGRPSSDRPSVPRSHGTAASRRAPPRSWESASASCGTR